MGLSYRENSVLKWHGDIRQVQNFSVWATLNLMQGETMAGTKATDARRVRRHNELSILSVLRNSGSASRPEIARRVALTPQAVNGIFEYLLDLRLVTEDGKRVGAVGPPSIVYSLCSSGAYAIGLEFGPDSLETALVNFKGQMIYRVQTGYDNPEPEMVRSAVEASLQSLKNHMRQSDMDIERIVAIGIIEPAFVRNSYKSTGAGTDCRQLWENCRIEKIIPDWLGVPVFVESGAIVGAVSMKSLVQNQVPGSYLYLSIGHSIESCLVLNNKIHRGENNRAGSIEAVPISLGTNSQITMVGDVATFSVLQKRLMQAGKIDAAAVDFYQAMHQSPEIVEKWIGETSDAIFIGIMATQAISDIEAVYLLVDPPNMIGTAIAERVNAGFEALGHDLVSTPVLHLSHSSEIKPAVGAACMALHEHFSPNLEQITDIEKATEQMLPRKGAA